MLCLCRPPIVSKMRSKSVISNNMKIIKLTGGCSLKYIYPRPHEKNKVQRSLFRDTLGDVALIVKHDTTPFYSSPISRRLTH
jgi:hypothetical protein